MKTNVKANAVRNMNTMTVEELKNKMGDALCVTVTFLKRSTGELRTIRCTRNFKFAMSNADAVGYVAPNGKGLPYNNEARGLVTVFDLDDLDKREIKRKFKQIPANSVLSVVVG